MRRLNKSIGKATLKCPGCGSITECLLWEGDPPNAVDVVLPCYECGQGGKDVAPEFYDAEGGWLEPPL